MSNAVLTSPHFRPFLCVLYCFRVEGSQPLLVALCGLLSSVQPYEQAKLFHLNNITPNNLSTKRHTKHFLYFVTLILFRVFLVLPPLVFGGTQPRWLWLYIAQYERTEAVGISLVLLGDCYQTQPHHPTCHSI